MVSLPSSRPAEDEIRFAAEAEAYRCVEECCNQGEGRRDVADQDCSAEETGERDNHETETDELGTARRTRILGLSGCSQSRPYHLGEQQTVGCTLQTAKTSEREHDGPHGAEEIHRSA